MRRPSLTPLWRESRVPREFASLMRDPVLRGEGIPAGHGEPVLVIPGFLAGDGSLGTMTSWLRRLGYRAHMPRIRANIDCAASAIARLETRLEDLHDRYRRPIAIIGQSRGGCFARLLAVRRPELVSGIVTLGSPLRDQLAVHPLVQLQVLAVGALGTLGAPGLFTRNCLTGDCCAELREQSLAELPEGVGFVSVYSRSDGIVDWHSCLDPCAQELVEIRASHIGMAVHAGAYRAIGEALASFAGPRPAAAELPRAA
jgi:pimeloyl-ACP methyl ester carboxylesterase